MPKATGLLSRKAYYIDRESVLIGAVRAGEGAAAESRTGAARLLSFKLNNADMVKFVATGGADNSAGGYLIQVAHVAEGGALANANPTGYVTIGTIVFSGKKTLEVGFTGAQIEELVKGAASPAITGDVRVVALRLVAGDGTGTGQNGVAVPAGSGNTIHVQNGGN